MGNAQKREHVHDAVVLTGGGEMAALIQSIDWSATPIGPMPGWPQSLRSALNICLNSRFPILIWWGPELVMLYNDAYRPILGATKHPAAMGMPGRMCWPEIWQIIGPMLEGVLTRGEATWSDDQLLILDRNGYPEECYFTFSYSPIREEDGTIGGVFTAVTETTERVLSERRMRTLRDLAERASDARTDAEACQIAMTVIAANRADIPFAALYLLDQDRLEARLAIAVGLEPGSAACPEQIDLNDAAAAWPAGQVARSNLAAQLNNLVERFGALESGPWDEPPHTALVLPIASAGGCAGVLVAGVSPHRALDDDYRGFFNLLAGHIVTAVTHARAYAAERQRAEMLAELDRAKTAFFSDISHEFRTPLTLLLAPLADLLDEQGSSFNPRDRELIEVAHRNALRLIKLVNTLLDFARIEAGRIEAVYEPTDLATYTADLANLFRPVVERAGLSLTVDCPALPEPVYVDRELWEKIVFNVLSNAFKFTFSGGITVAQHWAGDQVVLKVRDTGVGIPPEEIPHIFERFHRVRDSRARTHEGTGIGLALVQELVRLHGGSVEVTSAVGQGSTFRVVVPAGTAHLPEERIGVARMLSSTALGAAPYIEEALHWLPDQQADQPSLELPPRAAPVPAGRHARILVADDNADMRNYLVRLLSQRWVVTAVSDGTTALQIIRDQRPDLVLADVMMPGLDGFALLRALRSDPATSTIPIILLSARAGEEAQVEGLEAGADDYMVKPFSTRELMARVGVHLELGRVRREAAERERSLRAEAEAARAQLDALLERISEAFIATDSAWRCTYANRWAEQFLGRPRDALIGQPLWELFPELSTTSTYQAALQAAESGNTAELEEYYAFLGRWVEVRIYPSADGITWYFRDITARKRAEADQHLLTEVSTVLAASLDDTTTLARLGDLIVPHLADWGTFDVFGEEPATSRVEMIFGPPEVVERVRAYIERYPLDLNDPAHPLTRVLLDGQPELVSEVGDDTVTWFADDPERLRRFQELEIRSYMCVPLEARGQRFGVLTFVYSSSDRRYTPLDLQLGIEIARRAGLAIDNAHLYRRAQEELEQRRLAEEALRASEAQLRLITDTLPVLVAYIDHEYRYTFNNKAYETWFGIGLKQITGKPVREVLGDAAYALVRPLIEAALGGRTTSVEMLVPYHYGGARYVHATYMPDRAPDGTVRGAVALISDISDRRQAEERQQLLAALSSVFDAARDYEAMLARIVRLPVPMFADYTIIYLLDEQRRIKRLALAHADPAREPVLEELRRDYPIAITDTQLPVVQTLQSGQPSMGHAFPEAALSDLAHDARHLDLLRMLDVQSYIIVPLRVRGTAIGAMLFVRSDAQRRYQPADMALAMELSDRMALAIESARLYEAEQHARTEAETAIRMRDQFLSIAAHELRNPLTSLLGQAQLLQRRMRHAQEVTDRDRKALDVITEQIHRLNRMIDAMLDVSRIETGQLQIERSPLDVCALARWVVEEAQVTLEQHAIECLTPPEPLMIDGDAVRLHQVLQNLIGNAVKYSPRGGLITIKVERQAGHAAIAVIDRGIGIPEDALKRLFQRFYRAANAERHGQRGLGIGLYVVREIVSLHGGTVDVTSREGEGSTFTILLPLREHT